MKRAAAARTSQECTCPGAVVGNCCLLPACWLEQSQRPAATCTLDLIPACCKRRIQRCCT